MGAVCLCGAKWGVWPGIRGGFAGRYAAVTHSEARWLGSAGFDRCLEYLCSDDICIQDISVQAESTSYGVGCFDLALSANGPPTLGSTIQLVTTNVPSGTSLGFTFLSFTKFDPGIDLSSNGMPGCWQFVGLDVVTTFLPSGSVGVVPFQLPNSITFGGAEVRSQSATLSPATTPLGVITSNGIELVLGTY